MHDDFDTLINRKNTQSAKWDLVYQQFGDTDVLPMWVADMDFLTAPPVIDALKAKAASGIFGYPLRTDAYFNAIIGWVEHQHNWRIQKEWITYSPGVVTALSLCVLAYTNPGDHVIIQPPVYYPFFKVIENNGRRIKENPLLFQNNHYVMDIDHLESLNTRRTGLMIISNPHNPVGRVWHKEELRKIGEFCVKNDIILVSDEIHSDLIFPGYTHIPTASLSEDIARQTITCISPSKTFNLAGLKTSAVIIPNEKIKNHYNTILGNLAMSNDNTFGMTALEAAYSYGKDWLESLLSYLEDNRQFFMAYVAEKIPQLNVIRPEGTYLLWLDCRNLKLSNQELDAFFKKDARLWLDDGPMFGKGGDGFQRINIACPRSTLIEALQRIENAVKNIT